MTSPNPPAPSVEEADWLRKHVTIYGIEGEDGFVNLMIDGVRVVRAHTDKPSGIALIKLDAYLRAALASLAVLSAELEGMREPTEAMADAGAHCNSEWLNDNAPIGESRYRSPAIAVWRTMYRTARGEDPNHGLKAAPSAHTAEAISPRPITTPDDIDA